jgi:hypothetical protein
LRRYAKGGVGSAVAGITAAPLDDLKEEAFANRGAVELEILAASRVAVVEDMGGLEPFREVRIKAEAGFEIVIIVGRDLKPRETELVEPSGGGEDVAGGEGEMRTEEPKLSAMKWPASVLRFSAP